MKIYVSGKISGLPYEETKEKFKKAANHLQSFGHTTVNPLENGLEFNSPWENHLFVDLILLKDCDAIYLLDDWIDSRGAMIEKLFAESTGMKIMFQTKMKLDKLNQEQTKATVLQIEGAIEEVTGLKIADYKTESKARDSFFARMIFAYNCRKYFFRPPDIAKYINRDHTTVRHYLRKYDDEFKYNHSFRELANRVNQILNKRVSP